MNIEQLYIQKEELENKIRKADKEILRIEYETSVKLKDIKEQNRKDKQELKNIKNNICIAELKQKIQNKEKIYTTLQQLPDYIALKNELNILKGTKPKHVSYDWKRNFWLANYGEHNLYVVVYTIESIDKVKKLIEQCNFRILDTKYEQDVMNAPRYKIHITYKFPEKITRLPKGIKKEDIFTKYLATNI